MKHRRIAPVTEYQRLKDQDQGIVNDREIIHNEDNIDLALRPSNNQSELHARFSKECDKKLMCPEEYRHMMRSLNKQQLQVIQIHRNWCKKSILALKSNTKMPTYRIFLSGPGGTGKSHIIRLIQYETVKLLKSLSGHFEPDELAVVLCAFTGTAAFNIEGMTIHSLFNFATGPNSRSQYKQLSNDKLNTLRSRIGKLKLLIIDEISMVGSNLLYFIYRRLEEISGESCDESNFGNVSILAVGDLYQLQPVGQKHVFSVPTIDYVNLYGSLWKENFKMIELTQSMRQKGDIPFANMLFRLRNGNCSQEDLAILESRDIKYHPGDYSNILHVFKTNKAVDKHNEILLQKLDSQIFILTAKDYRMDCHTGCVPVKPSSKPCETGGLRKTISLAVGCRVMLTYNIDVSDGLCNGVTGTVTSIKEHENYVHTVLIHFDSDRIGRKAMSTSQYSKVYFIF